MSDFWRPLPDGVAVAVKVQPKSLRPGLHGVAGERLRIGVTEAPEAGRANDATCAALARALGVAPSSVQLTLGATSREKTLHVAGDPVALSQKLAAL